MRIGIDTFACDAGNSGIGVYVHQLLRRFSRESCEYELFGRELDRYAFSGSADDIPFEGQPVYGGKQAVSLWHVFRHAEFVRRRNYDVEFFPAANRILPNKFIRPSVGTVHDMAAYRGPLRSREHLGALLRVLLPDSLRHLDRIIAVSEWVKQELCEIAKVKEERIVVIPDGVDHSSFYPRPRNEESVVLIQPFSFRRPYILYASRLDYPVKNHLRLIDAFSLFKQRTRYPHRLVLAGSDSRGAAIIKKHAMKSPYRNDIFFTGHFPLKNLGELYSGADFVIIPSLYEGFGMGALEGMASGVPVLCSRSASLPEVADQAALYFDPFDSEDMADRMVTVTTDRSVYRECIQRGLDRAKDFSWDKTAEKTFEVLKELGPI